MTEKLTLNILITELSNLNSSYGNLIIDAIPLEKIIKKKLLILDENKEIIKNSTNLEDSGLFMSVPEKKQLEYLKEMVELHKELLNKLVKLDLKLNKLQGDINNSLSMLDSLESELWDVASGLEDVSFEIELNK